MGGSYMFVRHAAANLREKDDFWNPTIGGFVAGAILGTRCMLSLMPGGRDIPQSAHAAFGI
jgi:hypothetical protein